MIRCHGLIVAVGLLLSGVLLACGDSGADVCSGVDCGEHGACIVRGIQPVCACEEGWHADGLICREDWEPDGDVLDGDTPDGDVLDGDAPDGDAPDGDAPDGDAPDGDAPDGDAPDGDAPDGDAPDGDAPDGDAPDGDAPDGDAPDGDAPDGDIDWPDDGDVDWDLDIADGDIEWDSELPEIDPEDRPPIYISFLWHMHQPIYWPYESVVTTHNEGRMPYSLYGIFTDRSGPYTSWPRDAVNAGRGQSHLGAQVSFSGSLMENLTNLENAGVAFSNWRSSWTEALGWQTSLGNPRLDLVIFGYHHPLMGLIEPFDIRLQIQLHRQMLERNFGWSDSKGMFPPECAFTPRMIEPLVDEGVEWVLVDNIHFDRAHKNYPYVPESNLFAPNKADQTNNPAVAWVQLNGLWAPSKVSAPWGYQPHYVSYTNPANGEQTKIIAVPAARYEGNEDGRGGYGALNYEAVMSQLEFANVDPDHPILVVLHHDGDNYGGGTDSYYHSNFQGFVSWVNDNPDRFVATTVQDYLDQFPPSENDVIHVEDGSWSGADNGDPQFLKWNGAPADGGYSPDRNSWAVVTAARNRVLTAEAIQPHTSAQAILDAGGNDTDKAWHYLLNAETSCYWYWDGDDNALWNSHPTRGANLAVALADPIIGDGSGDDVAPSIYIPQRNPYNPGVGDASQNVTVWTYAYDVSGLAAVRLMIRVDDDGRRTRANEVYAPGDSWTEIAMSASDEQSLTTPAPTYKAKKYAAVIEGLGNVLIDYYVEAVDTKGNIKRTPIQHVWIEAGVNGSCANATWLPQSPAHSDAITVFAARPGVIHWGVNGWTAPGESYWPDGTTPFGDGMSVDSPFVGPDGEGCYEIELGPFGAEVTQLNFTFRYSDGSWLGQDHTITFSD